MAKQSEKIYDDGIIILNRKINYSIIRYYWDIIHHSVGELYDIIGFGRTKYNSIIYDEKNKDLDKEAKELQVITGIDKHYFTGSNRFEIDKNKELDWKKYFELCNIRKKLKSYEIVESEIDDDNKEYLVIENDAIDIDESIKKVQEQTNKFANEIKLILRNEKYTYDDNRDMFMLKYFIQNGKSYTTDSRLQNLIKILGRINFNQLSNTSNVEDDTLEKYIEMLTYQLKISEAVLAIRKYDK